MKVLEKQCSTLLWKELLNLKFKKTHHDTSRWNPNFINCKRKAFNSQNFWKKPRRKSIMIFIILRKNDWNQDPWVQQRLRRTNLVSFLWVRSKFLSIKSVEMKVQKSYSTSMKTSTELIRKSGRNGNKVGKVEFHSNIII